MNEFNQRLKIALQEDLPGEKAHAHLVDYERKSAAQIKLEKKNVRESGVVVLSYPKNDEPHFLLLKRHDYEGVHSGQVGLPGGKKEDADSDLMDTAIRECHEECGIKLERSQVIGVLSEIYIPPSNFLVYPYVASVDYEPDFVFDAKEVRFEIEVPFSELTQPDNIHASSIFMAQYERALDIKHFNFGNEIVWGATAMMLAELKDVLNRIQP